MTELENRFHKKMLYICSEANKHGYNPTIFASMVTEYGGVKAAKKLVVQSQPTDGFVRLWTMKRLDLTAERFVIDDEFRSLFTEDEIQICKDRLKEYQFKF